MQFSPVDVPVFNSLTDGGLHLWLVDFTALAPEFERYQQFLTSDQLVRMRRFARKESQRQFVFSHVALSRLIASYSADSEEDFRVIKNKHGKPLLEGVDLAFNLTHSGGCAMIGFSRGVRLGVDIELVRERESLFDLMARYFSAEERLWVLKGDGSDEQSRRFYQVWVAKEAYLKAVGVGLTVDLASFSVNWLGGSRFNISHNGEREWSGFVSSVECGVSNYCAAFCVNKPILSFQSFQWSSDLL